MDEEYIPLIHVIIALYHMYNFAFQLLNIPRRHIIISVPTLLTPTKEVTSVNEVKEHSDVTKC